MEKDRILAIDNGTQSVRALLFDLRGNLVAGSRVALEPYFSDHPGWAEQQPEYYWTHLCRACRDLFRQPEVHCEAIAGVALTTQRATMINVDEKGEPLRPAMVWLDQRRTRGLKPLGGLLGLGLKLVGMAETLAYFQAEAEVNWIRAHQPEVWEKTHKYLFLSGYLTYRLCGRFVDSVGCQVGYIPFDYKRQRWAGPRDLKRKILPISSSLLPELIPPAHPLGEITTAAAEATGIPAGLPLIAAAADKACEVLGAGCLTPDVACLSYGTTATINTTHSKYVEAVPFLPPYPAAMPDAYSLEIQVYRGYWMVSWFKREFGQHEQRLAEERGGSVEELFDELVAEVEPGSMGLTLQPYWSPGIKEPVAKGAVVGFGDVHTRAHLYRAIIEGIA
ncbi:MAG: carbohydrate kinase, partial [bacterium]|nr:carbohydrate kinase [bacterium]